MRVTLLVLLLISISACAGPGPWGRYGVTQTEAATDLASCRRDARADVERLYSFRFPYPYPLGWNGGRQIGYLEWQQRVETFKSYEESRLATVCLRDKGYREER